MFELQHRGLLLFIGGLGAVFASLCCLGPLLLLLLGFSGAWLVNLTALEPYRPVFIIISLVALFFAWQHIFRPIQSCRLGESCVSSPGRRWHAVIFCGVLALLLLTVFFPYIFPLFY